MKSKNDSIIKFAYTIGFTLLGFFSGLLIHGLLELFVLNRLLNEFDYVDFHAGWDAWLNVNSFGVIILAAVGSVIGMWQGRKWWRKSYDT